MRKFLISVAALATLTGTALIAQQMPAAPGAKDPSRVTGGTYQVDPGHTQVAFAYDHMGFSNNFGIRADCTVPAACQSRPMPCMASNNEPAKRGLPNR